MTKQNAKPFRLVCIADSQSKRWSAFDDSIEEYANATGDTIEIVLIQWIELIQSDGDLSIIESFDQDSFEHSPAVVRIESPGKNHEVMLGLVKAGVRESGLGAESEWLESEYKYELGKIVEPRLVFLGLKRILSRLAKSAGSIDGLTLLADPNEIVSMFDKNETSQRLAASEVSTPEVFNISDWPNDYQPAIGDASAADSAAGKSVLDLYDQLGERGFKTFFAKLAFGSASCGIVMGRVGTPENGVVSTMTQIDGRFYNTRKLQNVGANQVGHWLNFLIKQGVTIQKGISKSTIDGDNFDVRVIVIEGKVEFTIFRVSRHPVTGLHFGGYRGDWDRCRAAIPDRAWYDAMDSCQRAAELYNVPMVGVDLAFDRSYMNHFIIELNPFGDFFPVWTNKEGKSIHRVEIESMISQ